MKIISSQLHLFESHLRKSQKQLQQEIYIRDQLIKQQQKQITELEKEYQILQSKQPQKKPFILGYRSHSSGCLDVKNGERHCGDARLCLNPNEKLPFMNPLPLKGLIIAEDLTNVCQHRKSQDVPKVSSKGSFRRKLTKQKAKSCFKPFLKRQDILETVYSVDIPDSDGDDVSNAADVVAHLTDIESDASDAATDMSSRTSSIKNTPQEESSNSLHPKTSKFKAFTKGKAKSAEELRCRFRHLVDKTRKCSHGSLLKSTS